MKQTRSRLVAYDRWATPSGAWRIQTVLSVLAMVTLLFLLGGATAQAATQTKPLVRIASNPSDAIGVEAHGAMLEDVLNAIAAKTGVEVVIEPDVPRPPVNITMPMAPMEDVLRELLRGRNYALVYDGEDALLSQVIVLRPSVAGSRNVRTATYKPPYRR